MAPSDWIVIPIAVVMTLFITLQYVFIFIKLNEPYRKMKKKRRIKRIRVKGRVLIGLERLYYIKTFHDEQYPETNLAVFIESLHDMIIIERGKGDETELDFIDRNTKKHVLRAEPAGNNCIRFVMPTVKQQGIFDTTVFSSSLDTDAVNMKMMQANDYFTQQVNSFTQQQLQHQSEMFMRMNSGIEFGGMNTDLNLNPGMALMQQNMLSDCSSMSTPPPSFDSFGGFGF